MSKSEFNKSMLVMQGVKPEIAAHIVGQVETLKAENERIRALLAESLKDTERLDWMNTHQASVEVNEPDPMPCLVQASDEYQLSGRADPYDVRAAIDAAIKAGS